MIMFPPKDVPTVDERSYKDYIYNSVSTLDTCTANLRTEEKTFKSEDNLSTHIEAREIFELKGEMEKKGSKKLQYIAASAGK